MKSDQKDPKEILKILHSISNLKIVNGSLEVQFDNDPLEHSIYSFQQESFTYQLLQLIDAHLNVFIYHEDDF